MPTTVRCNYIFTKIKRTLKLNVICKNINIFVRDRIGFQKKYNQYLIQITEYCILNCIITVHNRSSVCAFFPLSNLRRDNYYRQKKFTGMTMKFPSFIAYSKKTSLVTSIFIFIFINHVIKPFFSYFYFRTLSQKFLLFTKLFIFFMNNLCPVGVFTRLVA